MKMGPAVRKLALTAHVISSVGWLGAVTASLALGVAAVTSRHEPTIRGIYLTLELMAIWVLVPLSVASLATGLIQSFGTVWGLFRHYWVLAKLVINLFASLVLLLYTQTLDSFAAVAGRAPASEDLLMLRSPSVAIHSAGAMVLLVVATVLSVYKPRGMTRYGQRKQPSAARRTPTQPATVPL